MRKKAATSSTFGMKLGKLSIVSSLLIFATFSFFSSYLSSANAASIAIIKSKNIEPYNRAIDGVRSLVKGTIEEKDINASLSEGVYIVRNMKSGKPDVFLSIGAEATYVVCKHSGNFPVVFSMVTEPNKYTSINTNITGVRLEIPLHEKIEAFKQIMPGVKKIAVMYGDQKSRDILKQAKPILREKGIELVTEEINSPKDIASSMKKIVANADAIWLLFDSTVTVSPKIVREAILLQALRHKIPVIGFNKWSVTAGALFTFYSEYEDIGMQTGRIVNMVLDGATPSSIPVESPKNVKLFFNDKVIERVGSRVKLNIPANAYLWGHK